MVVIGEGAVLDFLNVLPDAGDGDLRQLGKTLGELGLEVGEDAEQVVAQQDLLPVGAGAGPDAYGGDGELLGD